MNIDFATRPGFSVYVVLLALAGVWTLGFSSPMFGRPSRGLRLLNLAFGVGFIGYAFYLAFLFDGGTYIIFFKAFIVPVLLTVQSIRSIRSQRVVAPTPTATVPPLPANYAMPGTPSDPYPAYPAPSHPAQAYPAQSYPSYPAPSYPAQTYPAQTYPAQTYPAQTYPAPEDTARHGA